jgi:hypothetical protein
MLKSDLSTHQKKGRVVCLVTMACLMLWGKGGLEVGDEDADSMDHHDPTDVLADHWPTVGLTQLDSDDKNNTGLIVEHGPYNLVLDLGNMNANSRPSAVTLTSLHRMNAAYCNPQRIWPFDKEVLKITYKAAYLTNHEDCKHHNSVLWPTPNR